MNNLKLKKMGNQKEIKKKVLDVLKEELQPISEQDGAALTGGFTGAAGNADSLLPIDDINVPCNVKNTSCPTNTVANCGGSTT
jgi:hypothetical protein